jgi:2'-5' RNA ligase
LGKIRTFIAVDIDEEKLKKEIVDFQRRLLDEGADLKLVTPENIHLTLCFLGEVDEEEVAQKVVESMKQLNFQQFEIQFKGVGAFPSLTHMNVIWIAIRKGAEELEAIAEALKPRLSVIGIHKDSKGFSAHLTVARVRTGRNKHQITRLLSELSEKDFGSMRTESVRLKKSVLTPKGPVYSTIFEVKAGNSVRY